MFHDTLFLKKVSNTSYTIALILVVSSTISRCRINVSGFSKWSIM